MINSLVSHFGSYFDAQGQISKKKQLMAIYKKTGELTGIVNKVATDVVKNWHFEKANPRETGRNKLIRAYNFATKVKQRNILFSQMVDKLVTGEGYGWMRFVDELSLKESIVNRINQKHMPLRERKELFNKLYTEIKASKGKGATLNYDEHLLTPKNYRSMASSTMEIIHDRYDVLKYRELVGQNEEFYSPEEIIHFPYLPVDGKINGFTPIESILVQIELINMMWLNMLFLNKNGGVPDFAFILKDVKVNSPEYKRIEQQLEKYKIVENKHGNMLFTGDLKIEALQQLEKMQFMDVGLYATSILAMQWELPKENLPVLMKEADTKEGTGGTSSEGYKERIQFMQKDFADEQNTQLWIPHFGVKIVFDNPNLQREIREQTFWQMKVDNTKGVQELLRNNKVRINKEKMLNLLELDEEDIEEIPEEELMQEMAGATGMGNQLDNKTVENGDSQTNRKDKKTEQENLKKRKGTPSGTGKEATDADMTEFKQLIGSDPQMMDLNTFVQLWHQDSIHLGNNPPRVFMRQNEEMTSFTYKSVDFVYKTSISTNTLEDNAVKISQIMPNVVRL
jgi:hypothetical protein